MVRSEKHRPAKGKANSFTDNRIGLAGPSLRPLIPSSYWQAKLLLPTLTHGFPNST